MFPVCFKPRRLDASGKSLFHWPRGIEGVSMRTRWIVLAALAMTLGATPVVAAEGGRLDDRAGAAASAADVAALRRIASRGDVEAMYELGMVYRDGDGAPKDLKVAFTWFRKAAARGKAEAMNEVGCAYSRGHGVPRNYTAALTWFRKAAAEGDVIAMLNVGVAYDMGQGVPIDDAEAVKWYLLSAQGGDPTAALYLGSMYERAEGVRLDFEEAARWYRKAAKSDDAEERADAQAGLDRVGEGAMPIAPARDATSLTAT